MKAKELHKKTKTELQILLAESMDKLRARRFDINLKQIKNVCEIRKTRKLIARILTVLKQKSMS